MSDAARLELRGWRVGLAGLSVELVVAAGGYAGIVGGHASGLGELVERLVIGGAGPEALLDDHPMSSLDARSLAQLVGYVPSNPGLVFSGTAATVAEELAFSLQILGRPEQPDLVLEMLREFELEHLADRNPFTLSGGEQARAALAMVAIKAPALLLLDDVFASMDPATSERMRRKLLARSPAGHARATIVETHSSSPTWAAEFQQMLLLDRESPPPPPAPRPKPASNQVALETSGVEFAYRATSSSAGRPFKVGPLDLQIHRGEVVALVGANGAGKTTFFKLACGLLEPDRGHVRVRARDESWASLPPRRRRHEWASMVQYVFQNPDDQLYQSTMARELEDASKRVNRGVANKDRIAEAVKLFGFSEFLSQSPYDLAPPLRRLLCIACGFVANPVVLLLDEPTAWLDAELEARLAAALAAYVAGGGAVLLISHDVDFITAHAHRQVQLADGRVMASVS